MHNVNVLLVENIREHNIIIKYLLNVTMKTFGIVDITRNVIFLLTEPLILFPDSLAWY